jgi:arylsulfate sulfotransferase
MRDGNAKTKLCALTVGALLWTGCGGVGGGGGGSQTVTFVSAPTVGGGSNAGAPLVRVVDADTNVPTRLEIVVQESGAGDTASAPVEGVVLATHHVQPVLGLKAGHAYDLTVTAIADGGGRTSAEPLHVEMAALPDSFPQIDVRTANGAGIEPGFTLLGMRNKDQSAGYIAILDASGDVVWFLSIDTSSVAIPLANGHIATILNNRTTIEEVDLLGNTLHTWYAARATTPPPANGIAVDTFTFHNDVTEVAADGTFLVPTDVVRFVDDFPTDETNPAVRATAPVLDEPIIEFGQADGVIRETWNFLDLLKPTRIGFDATIGLPANADWAHTNAVLLDTGADAIIASLRHQDAVVKASRPDGQLRWILAPPAN